MLIVEIILIYKILLTINLLSFILCIFSKDNKLLNEPDITETYNDVIVGDINLVTDSKKTIIESKSGTNTGDQTSNFPYSITKTEQDQIAIDSDSTFTKNIKKYDGESFNYKSEYDD